MWVGDITYIPLRGGTFGYLSLLMDLFSRRIVGWDYAASMAEPLVLSSLQSAIRSRQPGAGLIHHTDRGGQSAGTKYRGVLRRAGTCQSKQVPTPSDERGRSSARGRKPADCYDNAFMELCFGTINTELELSEYADGVEAMRELSSYVHYYNVERRHSSLGYVSPADFEAEQARGK